jgi:N-carbamoylputrescine amidase
MCLTGYTITKQVWDLAEPEGGPMEQWMTGTAKKHDVYLGAGLVEVDGEDYYNAYLVCGPDGRIVGRTRKTQTEFMFFKAGEIGSHIIETPIGRLGVGICADNHRTFFPKLMQEQGADILLMPHAWPAPYRTSRLISEKDVQETEKNARGYARLFAEILGVPVLFANQTGPLEGGRWPGLFGKLLNPEFFRYAGYSAIVDSDRSVKAQIEQGEGVITAEVTLDPSRKLKTDIPDHGGWIHPGNVIVRKLIMPIDIRRALRIYTTSSERRLKALTVSRSGHPLPRTAARSISSMSNEKNEIDKSMSSFGK